jgi:chromate reductase, NAD(P)H dehydrogenase (quinone)
MAASQGGTVTSGATRILLISGSTRAGSTNTAALRTAQEVTPPGVDTVLDQSLSVLPAFNPDDDHDPLPAPVAALRQQVAAADAVLICTPEYAGTLPGSFKNLLDWLVGGTEIAAKPTAWINVAAPGRGGGAHDTLAVVLGYVTADIIEPACRRLPLARQALGPGGEVTDQDFRRGVAGILTEITAYLAARPAE